MFLSLILIVTMAACSGGDEADADKAIKLKLAHTQSSSHPVHVSMERFADNVKEKSDGSIEIEIFPDGTLGDEREYIENLQTGTLDMAKVSVDSLGNFEDAWQVFSLPYVFEDMDHGAKFMNSEEVEPLYKTTVDELDVLGLTWYNAGARNYYTKDNPIEKPEDMAGLDMRVQSSDILIEAVE